MNKKSEDITTWPFMSFIRIKCLVKKTTRNVRDFGFAVTVRKIALSMFSPLYSSRRYAIYRINLSGPATLSSPGNTTVFKLLKSQDFDDIRQIEAMEEWLIGKVGRKLSEGGLCMAALENGVVKGFNIVRFSGFSIPPIHYHRKLHKDECFSEQITVRSDFRKKGLGTGLRFRVFTELRKRGYRRLYGCTDITNNANLVLSKKVGFHVIAHLQFLCWFGIKIYRIRRARP